MFGINCDYRLVPFSIAIRVPSIWRGVVRVRSLFFIRDSVESSAFGTWEKGFNTSAGSQPAALRCFCGGRWKVICVIRRGRTVKIATLRWFLGDLRGSWEGMWSQSGREW